MERNTKDALRRTWSERFCQVYAMLEKRGEIVKNSREKSKAVFAKNIGMSTSEVLDRHLNGKAFVQMHHVEMLCESYNISKDYMIYGKGDPFDVIEQVRPIDALREILPEGVALSGKGNIIFSTEEVFASAAMQRSLTEAAYSGALQRFNIPGIKGEHFAIPVNGNSMTPNYQDGDLVLCQRIENVNEVKDNKAYIVVTAEALALKRIQRIRDANGRVTSLRLISDNYLEHEPYNVPMNQVQEILEVKRRLSDAL